MMHIPYKVTSDFIRDLPARRVSPVLMSPLTARTEFDARKVCATGAISSE
jgi:hypothetical protein